MILKDNFYRILSLVNNSEGDYSIKVELVSKHPIFCGHFPDKPVVPGVCTLTVIKECLGLILGRDISFVSIKECKYLSVLLPKEGLTIIINLTITDVSKVRALVESEGKQILNLRAAISE